MHNLTLFEVDTTAAKDEAARIEAMQERYGMNLAQAQYWLKLSEFEPVEKDALATSFSFDPLWNEEILARQLFNENGIFKKTVPMPNVPRIASTVRKDGELVAHALLMPTTVSPNGCSPVPRHLGSKIGLIGAYVHPSHRGNGYARACVGQIAHAVNAASGRRQMCMTATKRIVHWCAPLFIMPTIARWNSERQENEIGYFPRR